MGYGHHIGNIPFGCQLCASGRFSRMGRPRLERLTPPHALTSSPSLSLFSFLFLTDFFRRRTRRTRGVGDGRRVWRCWATPRSAAIPGGIGESQQRADRAQAGGRQAPRRHWMRRLARRVPETFFFLFLCYFSFFSLC